MFCRNGPVLSRFLERLKLKTIPHVTPLIERMVEAENKNLNALKSIDKINKRIKELEFHVEKKIKKVSHPMCRCIIVNFQFSQVDTDHIGVGADITDPNSEEYKRIVSGEFSLRFHRIIVGFIASPDVLDSIVSVCTDENTNQSEFQTK